ncbi:MAG: DNA-deoxyinosine glycosylase [Erysipelotrichaceae bacterium]|nr:DNA-deoxyinosine glycosylase [Erysipelotrichaceae bacterium]
MRQIHNIEPIYNEDSKILILGSFPSVKSREAKFFYHHPQNRFWKVLAYIYEHDELITIEDKKKFLLENHIALWDVIESCDIKGSSDSSIENVKVNDINRINVVNLRETEITND